MFRTYWKRILPAAAAVVILAGDPSAYAQIAPRGVAAAAGFSGVVEATTRAAGPSVVEIFTTAYVPREGIVPLSADLVTTQRSSGSGVIVDPEGYIVTNAHVIRDAQRVRVELPLAVSGNSILGPTRRSFNAQVVGIDFETDLAVIKVDAGRLTALSFGDSDDLVAGQIVVALGSPLGLHNSVSLGVVSSVARQLEPESPMIYVQTDASINPGSSGGPLVDLDNRLVGINTLIMSQAGGYEGIGFAAPSNIVKTVYEQIRKNGRVRRGDIGVRAQTVTPVLSSGLGLPRDYGVILADVLPGSPADRAGLRPGDMVLTLGGKILENGRQLQVRLYRHVVGDVVPIEVLRDGQALSVRVTVSERQDLAGMPGALDPRENLVPRLGILAVALDARLAEIVPAIRVRSGIVVISTVAGAIDAKDGGLATGDIIFAVNRTRVPDLAALRSALERLKPGDPVVLQLERRGELVYLAFMAE